LENVSQGQTVTRLNTLALVFLPLSFVAVSAPNIYVTLEKSFDTD
jgi:hypothetical protein